MLNISFDNSSATIGNKLIEVSVSEIVRENNPKRLVYGFYYWELLHNKKKNLKTGWLLLLTYKPIKSGSIEPDLSGRIYYLCWAAGSSSLIVALLIVTPSSSS